MEINRVQYREPSNRPYSDNIAEDVTLRLRKTSSLLVREETLKSGAKVLKLVNGFSSKKKMSGTSWILRIALWALRETLSSVGSLCDPSTNLSNKCSIDIFPGDKDPGDTQSSGVPSSNRLHTIATATAPSDVETTDDESPVSRPDHALNNARASDRLFRLVLSDLKTQDPQYRCGETE